MQNNNNPVSPFMDTGVVPTKASPMIKSYFERDNIILIQEYLSICVCVHSSCSEVIYVNYSFLVIGGL